MSTITSPSSADITDKQREVLSLVEEGKTPTEIGKAMDISSQAVHGHLRRLREAGVLPPAAPKPVATTARRPAAPSVASSNARLDTHSVLNAVKLAAAQQRDALNGREAAIDAQIETLKAEKKGIADARKELDKMVPPEQAA
jgi:predicted ArsR family transcriptional regulator